MIWWCRGVQPSAFPSTRWLLLSRGQFDDGSHTSLKPLTDHTGVTLDGFYQLLLPTQALAGSSGSYADLLLKQLSILPGFSQLGTCPLLITTIPADCQGQGPKRLGTGSVGLPGKLGSDLSLKADAAGSSHVDLATGANL